jgi:hypothetical protein
MNIVAHLQELDDMIVEHTKPPVTTMLRNKVAFCIEQAQARAADVDRQEQTLARQIETIDRLMKENKDAITENTQLKDTSSRRKAFWDALQKQSDDYHAMLRSKQLNYDA